MPALLTRKSSRPKRRTARSTASRLVPGSLMSPARASAAVPIERAKSSSSSESRGAASRTRRAPSAASSSAVARPMPLLAPLTMTTRPSKRAMYSPLSGCRAPSFVRATAVPGLRQCPHAIGERAYSFDLDADLVPFFEADRRFAKHPDACRRARENQVAWLECRGARDEADDVGNAKDHVRRRGVLHQDSVQRQPNPEILGIGNLLARHQSGTDRAERIKALCPHPLPVLELKVARGDVIRAEIPRDVVQRLLAEDIPGPATDDDGEFGLVIRADVARNEYLVLRPDQRIWPFREQQGRLGYLQAGLGGVVAIVESNADHFRWQCDRQVPLGFLPRLGRDPGHAS